MTAFMTVPNRTVTGSVMSSCPPKLFCSSSEIREYMSGFACHKAKGMFCLEFVSDTSNTYRRCGLSSEVSMSAMPLAPRFTQRCKRSFHSPISAQAVASGF